MKLRSALLDSPIRIAVVGLVAVAVVMGRTFAPRVLGVSSATDVQNRFGGDNESSLTDSTPNPLGVSVGSFLGSDAAHIR